MRVIALTVAAPGSAAYAGIPARPKSAGLGKCGQMTREYGTPSGDVVLPFFCPEGARRGRCNTEAKKR